MMDKLEQSAFIKNRATQLMGAWNLIHDHEALKPPSRHLSHVVARLCGMPGF